jgi:hypothetical protein
MGCDANVGGLINGGYKDPGGYVEAVGRSSVDRHILRNTSIVSATHDNAGTRRLVEGNERGGG